MTETTTAPKTWRFDVDGRQVEVRRITGPVSTHYMISRRPTVVRTNAYLTIEESDLPAVKMLLSMLDPEAMDNGLSEVLAAAFEFYEKYQWALDFSEEADQFLSEDSRVRQRLLRAIHSVKEEMTK